MHFLADNKVEFLMRCTDEGLTEETKWKWRYFEFQRSHTASLYFTWEMKFRGGRVWKRPLAQHSSMHHPLSSLYCSVCLSAKTQQASFLIWGEGGWCSIAESLDHSQWKEMTTFPPLRLLLPVYCQATGICQSFPCELVNLYSRYPGKHQFLSLVGQCPVNVASSPPASAAEPAPPSSSSSSSVLKQEDVSRVKAWQPFLSFPRHASAAYIGATLTE